jgi:hypothetical protein
MARVLQTFEYRLHEIGKKKVSRKISCQKADELFDILFGILGNGTVTIETYNGETMWVLHNGVKSGQIYLVRKPGSKLNGF